MIQPSHCRSGAPAFIQEGPRNLRPLLLILSLGVALAGCGGGSSGAVGGESDDNGAGPPPDPPPPVAASCVESAEPAPAISETLKFEASDGAQLQVVLRGVPDADDGLCARPLIVEFSPYGGASGVPDFGPAYNYAYVHARGTGSSTGEWGAVGPRDQQDVSELLAWACEQPWSNGRIGLYGFSASAIAVYNSMHLPLACVEAAALMAGTHDLYRDLLYPGGIPAIAPAFVVGTGVGLPILLSAPDRLQDADKTPVEHFLDALRSGLGILGILPDAFITHVTEDEYWLSRTQRPSHGANTFPVLANTGFYDVESRGPFQSYQQLRDEGRQVHLRVFGAHDGFPAGTPGPFPEYRRWFDRFLLGMDNGIDREPRVQLLIGHGSYEAQLLGAVTRYDATDWPVPGTRWQVLHLDGARGGGAYSYNDGRLSTTPVAAQARLAYPAVVSFPLSTDPNTTSTITNGAVPFYTQLPFFTWQLLLAEPLSLTWTTPAFTQAVDMVGPASLELFVTTALPEADLYAVIADVWPDGFAHAVGIGRLRSSYPTIAAGCEIGQGCNAGEGRSLTSAGEIVQPYPDHSAKTPAAPGEARKYHIEFWPLGNRFQAGHRLRLYLVGAPAYSIPAPGFNVVALGGDTPSRLRVPVLPGGDLRAAIND